MLSFRVIESSAFIAAPLAGLSLAQYGADVIRVEMIGGGIDYGRLPLAPSGRSLYWTGLNKAKRSIAIDLRRPEGRELVRGLVTAPGAEAGILLTNIPSPWLAHAELARARADVITCTIEGNADGSTAVDYTVNCAAGYPAVTGEGAAPVNQVLPAWDIACAYQAAFALLAAAERRRRTGVGAELRLALSDVAFSMLSHLGVAAEAEVLQSERPAIGNYIFGAFGRDFATRDGRRVMVAGISSAQWSALVNACALADPVRALEERLGLSFAKEADRYEGREAIAALIEAWTGARTFEEVKAAFEAHRVCWGLYRTPRDLLANDPRASLANPIWERIETPGVGAHLAAGEAVRALGESRRAVRPAPLLGQHTDEVLYEVLGLGSGAVGRLHDQGVVAGPERDPTVG
ncbi:MAG TPA: CoA transferase [Caulobacteraceae bacterium]|nr:CoA transferase [Caulobacteraceae bacterium]